jgi:hypothetical protein
MLFCLHTTTPLSLRQEQEKNRAAAGGYEAARHGSRAVFFGFME